VIARATTSASSRTAIFKKPQHWDSARELAAHKLPEVEALIDRAQAMRDWLRIATDCSCTSLDVCGLFDRRQAIPVGTAGPLAG
jgi:hypothetical protein